MGKTLTCGEGGMVLTNDETLAENAGRFAQLNMRMTNFQATLLLNQLERFEEQVETRERNIAYLSKGMEAIDGLHPIPRDARATRWCFYYWDFRFVSEEFGGISRNRFLEALRAEGVPGGVGAHGEPIYNEGPFGNPELFDQLGLPRKYLGEQAIDYSTLNCPNAERVYQEEVCSFSHSMFLGDTDDMQLILDAFQKIRANVNEL
jgi:dTDP-4-amino-4,6-dideoxygalactose transaminase